MWTRMAATAEARARRTATSYYITDLLAEGQWPPIAQEGVLIRVTTTVLFLDSIHSNSPLLGSVEPK